MENVILDTNVFLVSISRKSPFHWIFRGLIDEKHELCVTTEILLEYEEIITRKMGEKASKAALIILENLNNINYVNTYYRFGLLADPDDNKFVDCAVAANATYIVSEDSDFNVLRKIKFPKIDLIGIREFKSRLT